MGLVREWWGLSQDYGESLARQQSRRQAIRKGGAECLAILEHSPEITLGRRPLEKPLDPRLLAEAGIALEHSERGGLATYHGPGQLVAYTMVNLRERGIKIRCFVDALEEACILFLAEHGVVGKRKKGAPGVWAGSKKIAAVGLHVSRGITIHGLALNLTIDTAPYALIQPCGFSSDVMTSLELCTGTRLLTSEVAPKFGALLGKCIEHAGCP